MSTGENAKIYKIWYTTPNLRNFILNADVANAGQLLQTL
jgi:hypothetical protein